jgi:hypothetical protein
MLIENKKEEAGKRQPTSVSGLKKMPQPCQRYPAPLEQHLDFFTDPQPFTAIQLTLCLTVLRSFV